MTASIRKEGCRYECSTTWRGDHGPDRSIPGTYASEGDVRQCEHGRLWLFTGEAQSRYFTVHDCWRRLSRWWDPIVFRRAKRALGQPTKGEPA